AAMIVCRPRASEVEASAELVVPWCAIRHGSRILVQKSIGRTELQARGLSKTVAELIERPKNRRQRIRPDQRIERYLRQRSCIHVKLLPQLVRFPLHDSWRRGLRWLARLMTRDSVRTTALARRGQAGCEQKQQQSGSQISAFPNRRPSLHIF